MNHAGFILLLQGLFEGLCFFAFTWTSNLSPCEVRFYIDQKLTYQSLTVTITRLWPCNYHEENLKKCLGMCRVCTWGKTLLQSQACISPLQIYINVATHQDVKIKHMNTRGVQMAGNSWLRTLSVLTILYTAKCAACCDITSTQPQ